MVVVKVEKAVLVLITVGLVGCVDAVEEGKLLLG